MKKTELKEGLQNAFIHRILFLYIHWAQFRWWSHKRRWELSVPGKLQASWLQMEGEISEVLLLLSTTTTTSLQSCPTLCNPIDGSPPGSPVPGIFQARTLEWVAISFSNAWKWEVKVKSLSHVWLLATPWTAAHWAPLSLGFSRQEYWSGVPLPSPLLLSRSHLIYESWGLTILTHESPL